MLADRWRQLPLRTRVVAAGTAVVFVLLLVAGWLMQWALQHSLRSAAVDGAQVRVADLAVLAEEGRLPDRLAVERGEAFVLVLDESGTPVAASANLVGEDTPEDLPRPAPGATITTTLDSPEDLRPGTYDLVARTISNGDTVYVALSRAATDRTVAVARWLLLLALPALGVLAAVLLRLVVGRTLEPIDRLRQEADQVTAEDLGRRVHAPDGQDEVARLARTLNQMLDRVEAASIAQTRFVHDASHELRSPLASLRLQAESLGDDALLADVLRLQHLTEQLLLLAKAPEVRTDPVDLDEVVDEALRLVDTSDVSVDVRQVKAVRTSGDATLLVHAVRNLLDNAVRHADRRVAVSCGTSTEGVWLAVEDDGAGVAPEDRTRIFERFVRLDEARDRDHGGAGLGLALAADLVARHGGSLRVTDSALGGARFEVQLGGSIR